jgi:hypothetical protein
MSGFDYYTIIGRNPQLFQGHVENTLKNAGLPRDQWDFHVLVYINNKIPKETTEEIISICEENDIHYYLHPEDPSKSFIERLYLCWNRGYTLGDRPLSFRAGSDQTWSPGAFQALSDAWDEIPNNTAILQAQTVEHMVSYPGSRHFCRDFGTDFDSYDEEAFYKFCEEISRPGIYTIGECLEIWNGCSWLQEKRLWEKYGPMPTIVGGVTGDVIIHDRYQRAGVPNYLVGDCITYHFVRGESGGHGQ